MQEKNCLKSVESFDKTELLYAMCNWGKKFIKQNTNNLLNK